MKATMTKTSKAGKRTHTLKEILERQEAAKGKLVAKELTDKDIDVGDPGQVDQLPNLFAITADDPFASSDQESGATTVQLGGRASPAPNQTITNLAESILVFNELINKEVASAAALLAIDEAQLKAWIDLQIEVPAKTILHLLRTMQNHYLDPLNKEIRFTQYEDGSWQVFMTIEGCSKLLNNHPQFNGLVFNQTDSLVEGVPEWIECAIFRRDRIMPITVREYFIEVRSNKEIWKKMPRRMLRHRALQQCVRLAIA
jgi:hypothetical protein